MEVDPATDVILMSAYYTTESAVEAVRKGASDYLNKPCLDRRAARADCGSGGRGPKAAARFWKSRTSCIRTQNSKESSAEARKCGNVLAHPARRPALSDSADLGGDRDGQGPVARALRRLSPAQVAAASASARRRSFCACCRIRKCSGWDL